MKNLIFAVLIFTVPFCSNAQNNKFSLHSAEVGFGGFYIQKYNLEGGGLTFLASINTAVDKNLISLNALTGAEIGVVGSSTYNFNEFSIQYGREVNIKKWLKFELFAGLGTYDQKSKDSGIMNGNSISFPFKLKLKFYFNDKFGMGLVNNYSVNNINNNFSSNLVFHYRFQ